MRKQHLYIIAGIFLASACSFAPKDTGKAYMFGLTVATVPHQQKVYEEKLTVAIPVAAPELDSYRIALVKADGRWDYYAGARWAEFLPVLVQETMMDSLETAGLFKSVTSDRFGVVGDYILKTEIREFQVEYQRASNVPLIKIELAFSLFKKLGTTPLAIYTVKAEAPATQNRLSAVQQAFAKAHISAQQKAVLQLRSVLAALK